MILVIFFFTNFFFLDFSECLIKKKKSGENVPRFFKWERNLKNSPTKGFSVGWSCFVIGDKSPQKMRELRFENVPFRSMILKTPFLIALWVWNFGERMSKHLEEISPPPRPFSTHFGEHDSEQIFQFLRSWKHVVINLIPLGLHFPSGSRDCVSGKGLVAQAVLYCGLNAIRPWRNALGFAAGSKSTVFTLWILHFINLQSVILELAIGSWRQPQLVTAGRGEGARREA